MDLNGVICRGDEDEEVVEIRGGQSISIGNPSFPVLAPSEFFKKTFHPSGYMVTNCDIEYYRMKDVSGIFQPSFITERDKKF
ncbi:MAG: hypothetical protein KH071_07700 [Paraprevotella sp.]|jgi:hypothetical protein|uniref:hypothetical protein n=1 Tax=Paraprevotella TaxID=577309 RepID=UPI00248FB29C|nr:MULTISPECIES: hypothetical protein [Paraprevotella]MBS4807762.1 hypothetical protein [Paraprevotella sp.]